MRVADERDKMRKKENDTWTTWSIDYAFMIDNGDLCTREDMERVGWDKTRDTVLVPFAQKLLHAVLFVLSN